jgi:integrase
VPDIDFVDNQIATVRRADEPDDPRTNQPLVKTMDYRSPLKDTLSKLLHRYIKNYRSKVPGARMHNYVFVSHKSGPTQGQPMSISALDKMIRVISKTSPELKNFHAHALRHKWNDRFSKLVDSMAVPLTPEMEERLRSYLQGRKAGSGSTDTYTRRHTEAMAMEAGLKLNDGTIRIPGNLRNES